MKTEGQEMAKERVVHDRLRRGIEARGCGAARRRFKLLNNVNPAAGRRLHFIGRADSAPSNSQTPRSLLATTDYVRILGSTCRC